MTATAPTLDAQRLTAALVAIEPLAAAKPSAVRVVRAPGRVNLIGEHTDYNAGLVMPVAIDLEIWMAFVPSGDRRVEITIEATGEKDGFDLDAPGTARGAWIDYVAGTAWALGQRGIATRGMRGLIAATLPQGAGLSSSAALELASAWALSVETPPPGTGMELARTAQLAENEFVGVKSGLMDQFASSLGRRAAALLLDCRSLEYRPVPLPRWPAALVVCNTGSERRLGSSEYNTRRAQCERAVEIIARTVPGVKTLRDVDMAMLDAHRAELGNEGYRRCEHVIRENERVIAAERALESEDYDAVGRLFAESHVSLRDLYEVSSPELDALVEIATATPGVIASRMTGAGFGGCTVNLVRDGAADALAAAVMAEYPKRMGLQPTVYVVEAAPGAGTVGF